MKLSNPKNFKVRNLKNGDVIVNLIKTNQIEMIKEVIKKLDFVVNVDYGNNIVLVEKKHGGYLFNFLVEYNKEVKNYISADYLSPEEATLVCTITDVSDLEIYNFKNESIDHDDEENQEMVEMLCEKLVGTQIIS